MVLANFDRMPAYLDLKVLFYYLFFPRYPAVYYLDLP